MWIKCLFKKEQEQEDEERGTEEKQHKMNEEKLLE